MRLLVPFLVMSVFLLTACEVEPSKSEKEAMELKRLRDEAAAKAKPVPRPMQNSDQITSLKPAPPVGNVEISIFDYKDRAAMLGRLGDVQGALENLRLAMKKDPKDRKTLSLLARATQKMAQDAKRPQSSPYYLESAEAVRKCVALYPNLSLEEATYYPVVFYNEACTHALGGDSVRALQALDDAVRVGFRDIGLLETDPELESIRKRPEFEALIRKVEQVSILKELRAKPTFNLKFALPDSEGKIVKLGDLKGQVVVVEFWGSSYPASRKLIPHLVDLDKRFREKNLRVIGINYEVEESENTNAAVAAFVKENQIPFPCLIGDEATRKQIPDFKGFPTTIFIDPSGAVRLKLNGYQTLSLLEAAVADLLKETAKPSQ